MRKTFIQATAFRFVLLIGIVNLFADLTYEGARSIPVPIWVCWEQAPSWLAW